jgi:tRNA uracil 4-sulfurtransferase
MHPTALIHYGELGLKGQNRKDFENRLRKNIAARLSSAGVDSRVTLAHRYLTLPVTNPETAGTVTDILSKTFGISWFAIAHTLPRDSEPSEIPERVLGLAKPNATPETSFRISAKRADKRYPLTSAELEREVGAYIIKNTEYTNVDLSDPDHTYYIEIDRDEIFIFDRKHPGPGGLPVGSSGKALVLLSGGFDSPIAAYLMAKRGCNIDFLNFYVKEPGKTDKIPRLASKLSEYTDPGRIHLAPYLPFNLAVLETKTFYELVLFRRFMLRIGENLAREHGYDMIVTGDSLGQVASQTVENIHATEDALDEALCLRPLIGMDKEDIITVAREIDIFDIAKEPEKDCCSLIDRHPKTKVTLERIREEEQKIGGYEQALTDTLGQISTMSLP